MRRIALRASLNREAIVCPAAEGRAGGGAAEGELPDTDDWRLYIFSHEIELVGLRNPRVKPHRPGPSKSALRTGGSVRSPSNPLTNERPVSRRSPRPASVGENSLT